MRVISVFNHKGGSGKSTLCLNLAHCYARGGLNVCIADYDLQGTVTNIVKMVGASVDIVPHSSLGSIDGEVYDVVLVDTPPYHTSATDAIVGSSDFVLIPLKPSYFDVLSTKPTIDLVSQIQQSKSGAKGATVLNMVKHRPSLNDEIRNILVDSPLPLLNAFITERISYVRSSLSTNGVFDSDDLKAKNEITSLASEILQLMNPLA